MQRPGCGGQVFAEHNRYTVLTTPSVHEVVLLSQVDLETREHDRMDTNFPHVESNKTTVDISRIPAGQAAGRLIAALGRRGWCNLLLAGTSVCWRDEQTGRVELLDVSRLNHIIFDHIEVLCDGRPATVTSLLPEILRQLRLALPMPSDEGQVH